MKSYQKDDLLGLVLAGGRSSRMGTRKELISYHDIPQKDFVFKVLEIYCNKVFTSVSDPANLSDFTNPIVDDFEVKGPLNGLLSAFKTHPDKAWITVPIDMPLAGEETIKFLIGHRDKNKVATCFYDANEEMPEPLLTIWEPMSGKLLFDFYKQGKASPRDFLIASDVKLVRAPDRKALLNVNTPQELKSFKDGQRKK